MRIGKAPRPDGERRTVRGVELGGGMKIFDWPVKFSRSVGDSVLFGRRGVISPSPSDSVLRRDAR